MFFVYLNPMFSCVVAKSGSNSFETVCLSKYGLLGIKIPIKARVDIGRKHLVSVYFYLHANHTALPKSRDIYLLSFLS